MNGDESTANRDVASIIQKHLWNDHRYQISATASFYKTLQDSIESGSTNPVGDEEALTSALTHSRAVFSFYNPSLDRGRFSDKEVWWVSTLGFTPSSNDFWQKASGLNWGEIAEWIDRININLSHIGWEREELQIPLDKDGQQFPLILFAQQSVVMLDALEKYVSSEGQMWDKVVDAIRNVQNLVKTEWDRDDNKPYLDWAIERYKDDFKLST